MHLGRQWDIFCRVIDNHGDLGVCWRLADNLASRGERIRLWIDEPSALAWMAPRGRDGVQVRPWSEAEGAAAEALHASDVLIEAFGCEIPQPFLACQVAARRQGAGGQPLWFNLEYLSAEPYVERSHGLPSPVMSGAAAGWTKHFFYPGFTARTGGLLREADLAERQQHFDRQAWLAGLGLALPPRAFTASLFCYEPPALPDLLQAWATQGHGGKMVHLLVTAGRAAAAVRACLPEESAWLSIHALPYLSQREFDQLLWACDLNLVRGEDSLVRALWAGRPLVWQLYPQDDGAHAPKLEAFLDASGATPEARAWHRAWNALPGAALPSPLPAPGDAAWAAWQAQAGQWREKLWSQADLASQLLSRVANSG